MATQTLLQMSQAIASRLNSDEFNSIGDTTESLQIANIIRDKYYDIFARAGLPENERLLSLNASTDINMPVLMFVPDGVTNIQWIKYFNSNVNDGTPPSGTQSHDIDVVLQPSNDNTAGTPPGYQYVTIQSIEEFLRCVSAFNPNQDNVGTFNLTDSGNTFSFYYKNDHQPRYCAIIADYWVIFDSYDSTQDDTLQSSKSQCFGQVIPVFTLADNFIPDLNDNEFPLLFNEALSVAFYELKQQPNALADREVKRQWSAIQKGKSVVNKPTYFDQLPNFGRLPRTGGISGRIYKY